MIEIDLDKISKNELATILIQKDKEIERLNNIIKELDKQNKELGEKLSLTTDKYEKKLFIKEKIIKEVREYLEKNTDNTNFLEVPSKELLEILDKENI